jgi:hypothetical protein
MRSITKGLSDYSILNKLHSDFLELDKKLSVNAMDFETISDHLVSSGLLKPPVQQILPQCMQYSGFTVMYLTSTKNRFRHIGRGYEKLVSTLRRNAMFLNFSCDCETNTEIKVQECVAPSWYVRPSHLRVA